MVYWLVLGIGGYTAIGLAFGLRFVARGVEPLDNAAVATGWGFRLLILPGAAALWPLLLTRPGAPK